MIVRSVKYAVVGCARTAVSMIIAVRLGHAALTMSARKDWDVMRMMTVRMERSVTSQQVSALRVNVAQTVIVLMGRAVLTLLA